MTQNKQSIVTYGAAAALLVALTTGLAYYIIEDDRKVQRRKNARRAERNALKLLSQISEQRQAIETSINSIEPVLELECDDKAFKQKDFTLAQSNELLLRLLEQLDAIQPVSLIAGEQEPTELELELSNHLKGRKRGVIESINGLFSRLDTCNEKMKKETVKREEKAKIEKEEKDRLAREEEERKKKEEEKAQKAREEQERVIQEEALRRQKEEEEALRKQKEEEEALRKQKEEEEALRKQKEEEETLRKQKEEGELLQKTKEEKERVTPEEELLQKTEEQEYQEEALLGQKKEEQIAQENILNREENLAKVEERKEDKSLEGPEKITIDDSDAYIQAECSTIELKE